MSNFSLELLILMIRSSGVLLHIDLKPVQFKVDTGADISVISVPTYQALPQRPTLKPSSDVLSSPGGMLSCKGQFIGNISHYNKLYCVDIYAIKSKVK